MSKRIKDLIIRISEAKSSEAISTQKDYLELGKKLSKGSFLYIHEDIGLKGLVILRNALVASDNRSLMHINIRCHELIYTDIAEQNKQLYQEISQIIHKNAGRKEYLRDIELMQRYYPAMYQEIEAWIAAGKPEPRNFPILKHVLKTTMLQDFAPCSLTVRTNTQQDAYTYHTSRYIEPEDLEEIEKQQYTDELLDMLLEHAEMYYNIDDITSYLSYPCLDIVTSYLDCKPGEQGGSSEIKSYLEAVLEFINRKPMVQEIEARKIGQKIINHASGHKTLLQSYNASLRMDEWRSKHADMTDEERFAVVPYQKSKIAL